MNDKDYELIPQEFVEQIAKNGRATMYEMRNIAREVKVLRAKLNAPKKEEQRFRFEFPHVDLKIDRNFLKPMPIPQQRCDSLMAHPNPQCSTMRCKYQKGHGGPHACWDSTVSQDYMWQ
jgi:hypothetical protein